MYYDILSDRIYENKLAMESNDNIKTIDNLYDNELKRVKKSNDSVINFLIELNAELNNFSYGIPKNEKIENVSPVEYYKKYRSLSVTDFKKYRGGSCPDFVRYQDYILNKKNIHHINYYIELKSKEAHTITIVEYGDKYYYIESSFSKTMGVWESANINGIINFVSSAMGKSGLENVYIISKQPDVNSSCLEYKSQIIKGGDNYVL